MLNFRFYSSLFYFIFLLVLCEKLNITFKKKKYLISSSNKRVRHAFLSRANLNLYLFSAILVLNLQDHPLKHKISLLHNHPCKEKLEKKSLIFSFTLTSSVTNGSHHRCVSSHDLWLTSDTNTPNYGLIFMQQSMWNRRYIPCAVIWWFSCVYSLILWPVCGGKEVDVSTTTTTTTTTGTPRDE